MSNAKLNGSVDMLAQAMRQVFQEGVEKAVEPIHTEMKALRTEYARHGRPRKRAA